LENSSSALSSSHSPSISQLISNRDKKQYNEITLNDLKDTPSCSIPNSSIPTYSRKRKTLPFSTSSKKGTTTSLLTIFRLKEIL
jgi:hypothetical protein